MYIEILRVIIRSHNLLIPGCYMYMPDEVFHDWKSIRIKEEKKKSPEAQNDIKMHFYDFYQINLYAFNKFQIYFINYSGF